METEEEAQEMVRYYREHRAILCGTPVSISMSLTMKTIEVLHHNTDCNGDILHHSLPYHYIIKFALYTVVMLSNPVQFSEP